MWSIPYERLTIKTSLRTEEAVRKLSEVVEPKRFVIFSWARLNVKPYEGTIGGTHFPINRIGRYRDSFLPMISGEIQPDMGGCSIKVSMAPHNAAIIFMAIWLGGIGLSILFGLGIIISRYLQGALQPSLWFQLAATIGMFIFSYGLLLGNFKFESVKSKAFLRELFQANQVIEFGEIDFP